MRPLHLLLAVLLSSTLAAADPDERPRIQVAILLDDSGSMSGLITQARAHLWEIVGQLSALTRDGRRPHLQVALYHYGDVPYLHQPLIGLSDDLDEVSRQLFSINGGGGEERCGEVIRNATVQLAWSQRPNDLKLILIAGNEPFTQGSVDWQEAVRGASARGIIVNTIHCGPEAVGRDGMWAEGARLGEGRFLCIDHNRAVVAISAPQDPELAQLNRELNATYLPFGAGGAAGIANQSEQDGNSFKLGSSSFGSRAGAKARSTYDNRGWDLVDALARDATLLDRLDDGSLPPALRGLARDEQRARIAEAAARRAAIRAEILRLDAERMRFVADAQSKVAGAGSSFGAAARTAISEQAARTGWRVEAAR